MLWILLPACIAGLLILILILPIRGTSGIQFEPPAIRFNEADAVLSRRLLVPGSAAYEAYYRDHPENKEADDRSRSAPGLLSPASKYFHKETFASADANFRIIESLSVLTHAEARQSASGSADWIPDPARASRYLEKWLMRTGAHSVGFTSLKEHHLYSHKGRGTRSGELINKLHSNAIAITVEMNHDMMSSAPKGSSVMESSEQYLNAGVLALKAAAYIRELGFEATAHIDGHYELICPLVAVDAGLGMIGRMGLLMTPSLGPRVRISVVTTDLPLEASEVKHDLSMLDFCSRCKKCATVCPAGAIPQDKRQEIEGRLRWKIDSEKCYHYWTVSGTDCGRCMSVCPYSHQNNLIHNFVRWGIKNNLLFRLLALKLDDVFYGKRPSVRALPGWLQINPEQ